MKNADRMIIKPILNKVEFKIRYLFHKIEIENKVCLKSLIKHKKPAL